MDITLRWQRGDATVRWIFDGVEIVRTSPQPFLSVARISEPASVVLVEEPSVAGVENAKVLNIDGSERLRLEPPPSRSPIGFDQVFVSRTGVVAVFATRDGDLHGVPDLLTGAITGVREWR